MSWDLEKGVLSLAVQKELLQLDPLLEKGILDSAAVERLMEEVAESDEGSSSGSVSGSQPKEPVKLQNLSVPHSNRNLAEDTCFGRYKNLQFVGRGAMAEVYKAFDETLNRSVALKLIRPEANSRARSVTAEARAQARIDHPNICKVYEVGELDGRQFIAMHYVEGKPLPEVARDLALEKVVWLFQQIAEAVHSAHRVGVIHRDLKPMNILVEQTEGGEFIPYVMDFGLAREMAAPGMTETKIVAGTPLYMSPEQVRGDSKRLDRRTDVFSLGATFYDVLSGKPPTEGATTADVLVNLLEKDPVPLRNLNSKIPMDLETIIMKCLEKDPERRYDSARALAEDLRRFLQAEPIAARKATWKYRMAKRIRKYPVVSALLAASLAVILITGFFALRTWVNVQLRERLLHVFTDDLSRETEAALRNTYTHPLHNAEPEKEIVRFAMREYEPKLKDLGSLALGPMHYLFGRDYMVMQDWELAKMHLDKAWNEFQLHNLRTAYVLAVTDAVLYRRKWNERMLFSGAQPAPTQPEFYTPALSYIEQGNASGFPEMEYARAWIAFLRGDPQAALRGAENVSGRLPWLYEARGLQGEIYMSMADEALKRNDYSSAQSMYRKGEARYEEAVKLAPSDSSVYEGLCSLQRKLVTLEAKQNLSSANETFQKALQSCKNATIANPGNAMALYQQASLLADWGEYQGSAGGDPTSYLQASADAYEAFCKMRGDQPVALRNLGRIYLLLAEISVKSDLDRTVFLSKAKSCLEKALSLNKADTETMRYLDQLRHE